MEIPFKIEFIADCVVSGLKILTTHASGETYRLWRPFRQQRREESIVPDIFYSIQEYGEARINEGFGEGTNFEKWAAIPISGEKRPSNFKYFHLKEGLYLSFTYSSALGDLGIILEDLIKIKLPANRISIG
jgi:hypothetical protein